MPLASLQTQFQKKLLRFWYLAFGIWSFLLASLPLHSAPPSPPNFTRDIAPILFEHCAPCHRPGQSAPFNLLTFDDARKHATDLVKVTRDRYMPPWLPEPGHGDFEGTRRLSDQQVKLFQDWLTAGTPPGDAADLPSAPRFEQGWQLGAPDLIVELPSGYTLAADGPDLYRNFVIPAPLKESRFIRAYEFQPRNRSVHHVRIQLDPTSQSRRLDEKDADPGFPGMKTPARFPPGHLLTWIPGKTVAPERSGLSWALGAGVDLVLQIHFQRTGKAEQIAPALGLYFTREPPAKSAFVLGLSSQLIDIPAGAKQHTEERSITLPAAVDILAILPHLHFLGREVYAFAMLPDGQTRDLLLIKDWNFNWQDQYRYRAPVSLPAGTKLTMRYTYDNSAGNPRNPHQPPRRVLFGPQSTDEMAELWLQLIPKNPDDLPAIQKVHQHAFDLETVAYYEAQLRATPNDAAIHTALGKVLGPMGRLEEAVRHFQAALELQPDRAEAHYYLGLSHYAIREWTDALQCFETVLRLDPAYPKAHTAIGLVQLRRNNPVEAEISFKKALELNPDDGDARKNLERLPK